MDKKICPMCNNGIIFSYVCCQQPIPSYGAPECCGDPDAITDVCETCEGSGKVDKELYLMLVLRDEVKIYDTSFVDD